jgi:hypothetical protein
MAFCLFYLLFNLEHPNWSFNCIDMCTDENKQILNQFKVNPLAIVAVFHRVYPKQTIIKHVYLIILEKRANTHPLRY